MKIYKLVAMVTVAMMVGFLTGCGSAEVIEPVAMPEQETTVAADKETTVVITENVTSYIPIGTLLDKLVQSGCAIDTLKYREIEGSAKNGGHVEVKCVTTTTDALSLSNEL